MIRLEREDDRVVITSPFHLKDLVKTLPGAKWDRTKQTWYAPLSWATCVVARGIFGEQLEVGPELLEWATVERARVDRCLALREAPDAPVDVAETYGLGRLWPFQRASVALGLEAERLLIASEMGTGKSVQGATLLRVWNEKNADVFPALIVCPNSMKRTWARELSIWLPEAKVQVISGGAAARRKQFESGADVFIMNWEGLRAHTRVSGYGSIRLKRCEECGGQEKASACETHPRELQELGIRAIIADEAHRAKNPRALQTRALWAVGHASRYRLALTGTPIANRPDDLWAIMHFVAPEEWPSRTRFIDRYALTSWNPFGGLDIVGVRPDTRDEFFKILDPRLRRDIKSVVLRDLPEKTYQTRFVDMTPPQARAYKELKKEMLVELQSGLVAVTNVLARTTRLWQLASSMLVQSDDGTFECVDPSCKIDALLELIDEAAGKPIVAFAESRKLIELCEARLAKEKIPFVSIHGKIGEQERAVNVEQFQTGKVPVCLATIKAGGVGITLTAAHAAVFLQRSWSLIDNKQAEDRVHRIGLDHPVEIIDLVTSGTVEEARLEGLEVKGHRLEEIVRDEEALRRFLEGEDE